MKKKLYKAIICLLSLVIIFHSTSTVASADGSAGIFKSVQVAPNIKVNVLNIHHGFAGTNVGNRWHTNVLVLKDSGTGKYVERRNYHVTAYTSGGSVCWNIWESHTDRQYHNCHSYLDKSEAQEAMQTKLKELIGTYIGNNLVAVGLITAGILIVWDTWPGTRVDLAN